MASSAPSAESKETKPKPRLRPLPFSTMILFCGVEVGCETPRCCGGLSGSGVVECECEMTGLGPVQIVLVGGGVGCGVQHNRAQSSHVQMAIHRGLTPVQSTWQVKCIRPILPPHEPDQGSPHRDDGAVSREDVVPAIL